VAIECDHEHSAAPMNDLLTDMLAAAIDAPGVEPRRLVSGAGHDAGVIAAVAPTAMLFIRSPGGVSHDPREAVRMEDVTAALGALVRCVEQLASKPID
jgi:allantoate deiminase